MRPSKLKLNEKQRRLVFLIKFIFSEENLLFFLHVKNLFSCYISFENGIYVHLM